MGSTFYRVIREVVNPRSLTPLQIVLYANTDGRGFFNKAAADDSDRSLIEYLRGMINIGEDNRFSYLRNQNFSSTIALELKADGHRRVPVCRRGV
ncbi:MAG: hypothetical protein ACLSE4_02245 [Clostridium sp.]